MLVYYYFTTLCVLFMRATWASELVVLKVPGYLNVDRSTQSSSLDSCQLKNFLATLEGAPIDQSVEWGGIKTTHSVSQPKAILIFQTNEDSSQLNQNDFASFKVQKNEKCNIDSLIGDSYAFKNSDDIKNSKFDCSQSNLIIDVESGDLKSEVNSTLTKYTVDCGIEPSELAAFLLNTKIHTREKRQVKDTDDKVVNEAEFYRDQYPAIFNIIFWTSLILGVAVFAISYNMWYMDPGLDTVIYRMTSQRIKKDQ